MSTRNATGLTRAPGMRRATKCLDVGANRSVHDRFRSHGFQPGVGLSAIAKSAHSPPDPRSDHF